jgi:MFS family permease
MWHSLRHVLRLEKDTGALNRSLRAMLVVSALYMFAFGMFSPLYAIFVEKVGGNVAVASNAWAVFMLVAGLMTFITGRWENDSRQTVIGLAWSQFIVGAAYLIYYLADGVAWLYVAQVLLGLGASFFWPAFHSLYGKHVDKRNQAKQWSIYDALAYLLPAGAAVLGGWLVDNYGFGLMFLVMAAMSLLCGIYILFLPKKWL